MAIAAFVYLDTDQTLTDNVETAISFTDEVFDTDNFWASSPNPTRLTVPSDGVYQVRGKIAVNASFIGIATARIYVNGSIAASVSNAGENLGSNNESHQVSALLDLTAGDYLELKVLLEPNSGTGTHDVTGGNSTVTTFAAFKVPSQGGGSGNITTAAAFSSRPAAGTDGDLFFPTDGFQIQRDNGATWKGWGPICPLVTPDDTGFSWVNQGSSSLTVAKDSLLLVGPADTTDNLRGRVKSVSAPYTIDAMLTVPLVVGKPFFGVGLWWRESSSGKLVVAHLRSLFGVYVSAATGIEFDVTKWNSPTSFNAGYVGVPVATPGGHIWIRIVDDNTDRKVFVGSDGQTWTEIHSVGRTDFLTADQAGFMIRSQNWNTPNLQMHTRVLSWNLF
jgi:hypothetical protein